MKHEKLTMPFETHQEITSIWFTVEDIMGSVDHQGWSITNGIVKTFFGKSTNYSNQIKPGVNMLRVSLLCVCLTAILPALPCRADEEMAAVVGKVKRAVVYIRVEDPAWKGSGSGFVISVKGDTALIATNYHVIAGPNYERHPHPTPREVIKTIKSAAVTTVFDSGAKTESV